MSITISQQAFWELFSVTQEIQNSFRDEFETVWQYPQELGQGNLRYIQLREGLELTIADYQLYDSLILKLPEREHSIEYTFYLSGGHKNKYSSASTGQYAFCGTGIAPQESCEWLANEKTISINVHIQPEFFHSYLGIYSGQNSSQLAYLVGKSEQRYYVRSGNTTPTMAVVLQHILQCPYQGITKGIYLESKVLELMALLIEEELASINGNKNDFYLKPNDIERIYCARDILLRNIENPPSLIELARLVGLNDCTLKRGFRYCFGTTAFGYLHHQRLEKAAQLLAVGNMSIREVTRAVGFADRSYFATAFRKKYGVNPSLYLKTHLKNTSTCFVKNSA
ncbi:transcriptional regulator [Rivularia sp. IAM M-261]|nr:transcriptional regulator [Calothrix sp. PCC 7716]GJD15942.1 transcriptional regulator [Rivularia sp. IAM M-261]